MEEGKMETSDWLFLLFIMTIVGFVIWSVTFITMNSQLKNQILEQQQMDDIQWDRYNKRVWTEYENYLIQKPMERRTKEEIRAIMRKHIASRRAYLDSLYECGGE